MLQEFEAIDSHESLLKALKEHLNHCECGSEDTVPMLRDFLRLVRLRIQARTGDAEGYSAASRAVEKFLVDLGNPALSCWWIYLLEAKGIVVHGFNIFDVDLSLAGEILAAKIEQYGLPPKARK